MTIRELIIAIGDIKLASVLVVLIAAPFAIAALVLVIFLLGEVARGFGELARDLDAIGARIRRALTRP